MKEKTYRSNSLTVEEQERLISATTSYEDLTLFKLALTTGIRREDIVNIEMSNIDLEKKTLTFFERKKNRNWTVPLLDDVVLEMKRFIATKPKKKETPKQEKHPQRYLFTFSSRTAYNKLQRALQKAGISKELYFHDLRRSFIKTAKKRGLSPKAVSQITGDSLETISRYYENLDMEELHEELRKMGGR